jgi:transcriptional regulator with XRE-family HTH domain
MPSPGALGRRLRRLRQGLGLTLVALAAQAQCSDEYIRLLETGQQRDLTVSMARRLAKALGVSLMELLGER